MALKSPIFKKNENNGKLLLGGNRVFRDLGLGKLRGTRSVWKLFEWRV